MRWLSPLKANNRHQGVRTDRFDSVGDWFLETRSFGGGAVVRVQLQGCLVLHRESGCGKDISEVRGGIL